MPCKRANRLRLQARASGGGTGAGLFGVFAWLLFLCYSIQHPAGAGNLPESGASTNPTKAPYDVNPIRDLIVRHGSFSYVHERHLKPSRRACHLQRHG
jgi:hypothetical protein